MKGLFTLTLILVFQQTFAQHDPLGAFNKHVVEKWAGDYIRVGPYQVKGSPYLLGASFPGIVSYRGGSIISDCKVFYDLYYQKAGLDVKNDFFEASEPIDSFSILLPESFGGQKLNFHNNIFFGEESPSGYFNILCDGEKASFLKLYKSKLAPDPTNTLAKEMKIFEQYFEYYIYDKVQKKLHKIKLKKKQLMEVFKNNQNLIKYIAMNNLDLSNEKEVSLCINYYNSLNLPELNPKE